MLPFSWFKCLDLQRWKSYFFFLLNLLERCSHRSHSPWLEGWSPSLNHQMSIVIPCNVSLLGPSFFIPFLITLLRTFLIWGTICFDVTKLVAFVASKNLRVFLRSFSIVEVLTPLNSSLLDKFLKLLHKEWEVFFIFWFFIFIFLLHWRGGFKCNAYFPFVGFFILIKSLKFHFMFLQFAKKSGKRHRRKIFTFRNDSYLGLPFPT